MSKVTLKDIVDCFSLEVLTPDYDLECPVKVSDINQPGLVLAGYVQYFDSERIQVVGTTETEFVKTLEPDLADERWFNLFQLKFPCLIISRSIKLPKKWLEMSAGSHRQPIFRTHLPTTRFMAQLTDYLQQRLAPSTTIHAVFVDVHGIGTLIIGESGVGKSESALELIRRGHRLVADDAVDVIRSGDELIGSPPEMLKHIMEIRGLGILNIKALFGIGAVRNRQKIHLVIRLEEWEHGKQYDRLGIDEEQHEILGISLPCKTIPVRTGRNLSNIIEVAAMNYRLKNLGYDAAEQFIEKQRQYCLNDHKD